RPAVRGGKSRRLRRQSRSRGRDQFAARWLYAVVRRAQQRHQYLALQELPYDFIRDTVPVASIMQLTNMMVVPTSLPVKTVQEFIDYCKANPGKVFFASSGNGTSVHMSGELFKALAKVEMTHVPYRGSSAAMPDLISNKVQVLFDNLPSALEQVRGGTLRALGVTSPRRW